MKLFFGVAAGMIVAFLCVWLIQSVGHSIFPLPAAIDPINAAGGEEQAAALPVAPNAVVLLAWFVGVLLGGWAGNRVAGRALPGWIVALLILGAGIANLIGSSQPWWMWAGALVLPLLAAAIAQRLARVSI